MNKLIRQLIDEDLDCLVDFQSDMVLELENICECNPDYESIGDLIEELKNDLCESVKDQDYRMVSALGYILDQLKN